MGCIVPAEVDIRVWDSSAEVRYLVVPERPAGTEGLPEEELAALVTRGEPVLGSSGCAGSRRRRCGPTRSTWRTSSRS